jgi:methionine biosynthesis protein MetW
MTAAEVLRADLRLVADLIPRGSRVLDLGCSDGALLAHLRDTRECQVRGIEISTVGVTACVARGLPVIQADLDEGLADLPDGSFDVVVLSQTLQEVRNLRLLIAEMMRVGDRAIISYPNFAHVSARVRLGLRGRMPVSETLPYQWYDTPNVHYTTIKDFRLLCEKAGLRVERQVALRIREGRAHRISVAPNLRADLAVAVVGRADAAAAPGGARI